MNVNEFDKNAFFSVIVPIYNGEKYLKQCLDSICMQTFNRFEVIIIDDGSTDKSFEICKKYEEQDSRFKVIQQKNSGPNMARKNGLHYAKGKYTIFIDGDDWIERDSLERYYDILKNQEYDILILDFYQNFENRMVLLKNNVSNGQYKNDEMKYLYSKLICGEKYFEVGIWPSMWSKVFRTDKAKCVINRVDDRLTFGEDAAFSYLYIAESRSAFVAAEAFYHYRDVEKSLSKRVDPEYWEKLQFLFNWFDENMVIIPKNQVEKYKLHTLELSIERVLFQKGTMFSNVREIKTILKSEVYKKQIFVANTRDMESKSRRLFWMLKHDIYFYLYVLYLRRKFREYMRQVIKGKDNGCKE